ncbi:MAG: HAMP domain-containing protein, partial [Oscillospiraceae bacterium]|nr:HAMP domain-containing protein [Oscillospiraceae bacterium]
LDAETLEVLATSDSAKSRNHETSDNIIAAMTGVCGNIVNSELNYMDYAVPIKKGGEVAYILYVKDTKDELNGIMQNIFYLMMQALLFGVVFAVLIGYLLSRTITVPIINLIKRAERMAAGKTDKAEPAYADDEIGRLGKTFYAMSSTLTNSLKEISGEKAKMEEIFRNITDGILAFDTDGYVIHGNTEAQRIFGVYDFEGMEFDEIFKDADSKITIGDLLYIDWEYPVERTMTTADGRLLKMNFASFNNNDTIDGVVAVIHDITKQQELELSRREFVANVSHELRTPLTTIKSYTETLLDMSVDGKTQEKFLSVIESEADRMTRIVKDLLTLSQLDSSADVQMNSDKIDVNQLLERIVQNISINAENKGQTLTYKSISDTPAVTGNRDRLEQVIINIISNAIKYTPEGGNIEVYSGALYNDVYIKVVDNGIGIPEENMPHIFERFYRVDKARSRETGGTGLGLAIAKQIIESFGGNIKITSEYNKGTEVIISVPV